MPLFIAQRVAPLVRYVDRLNILLFSILLTLPLAAMSEDTTSSPSNAQKQTIKSLYIPLADHYAALIAYERYRDQMKYADFQIEQMGNWDLLRAKFQSEQQVDMAYVMSPLAMDMFHEKPHFQWIGLMHRDGNALAINDQLNDH